MKALQSIRIMMIMLVACLSFSVFAQASSQPRIKKVLVIGDSMTGWLAERLNAYGKKDGFDVATVIWDGSTIKKWAASPNFSKIVKEQKPDAIFICLGMNELFTPNPEKSLGASLEKFKSVIGNTPYLWIGPPSWPGKKGGEALNTWLATKLGQGHYFNSSSLNLSRQSRTNPHPTRAGICTWVDAFMKWIPANTDLNFRSTAAPAASEMSRPSVFIYKKMKQAL
ncbi:MAG: hypothetical protein NC097_06165 [Clostridium sp.]|nr:hypothetical protein [Prevotella sp.]MCM1429364.1 hypothetical protein [Clostridium sp.]MCM1475601.1 hypothetical protein [Muribaculaceae bacterium]